MDMAAPEDWIWKGAGGPSLITKANGVPTLSALQAFDFQ